MELLQQVPVLLLAACFLFVLPSNVRSQNSYFDFDDSFADRMILKWDKTGSTETDISWSPGRTAGVFIQSADFSQPPPWNSVITISGSSRLDLQILDHASYPPSFQWLSDQMLFVKIWWGRALGTDAILDIISGEWLFRKMFVVNQLVASDTSATSEGTTPVNLTVSWRDSEGQNQVIIVDNSSVKQWAKGRKCVDGISNSTWKELTMAIVQLQSQRSLAMPPCKPGPCSGCITYTMTSLNSSGVVATFEQSSACLANDPDFRRVIGIVNHASRETQTDCSVVLLQQKDKRKH